MARIGAFAVMAVIWGLTWLPMKLAAEAEPPIFFAVVRFFLSALLFFLVVRLRGLPLRVPAPGRVVVASLLITTGCYSFLFWGVAHAPSGVSAIVNLSLMPILLGVIGFFYGQERITARRLGATAAGIGGLVLLFGHRVGADGSGAGLLAVAAGTLSYAWGSVASRPLVQAMPPLVLGFWETLIGAVGLLPVTLAVEGYDPARFAALLDPRVLLGLGVLVLGGSLLAFSIYLWLVREWGAFRAGLYSFVSPAIAVTVGTLVAGEPFGPAEAAGMAVMLGATALCLTERRLSA